MRVYGFIGEKRGAGISKRLIEALNGRLPQETVAFLVGSQLDGLAAEDSAYVRHAFRRHLCELVDEWINSGKLGEEDRPWQRSVSSPLPHGFTERNPPALLFDAEGPYLILMPRSNRNKTLTLAISDGAVAMFIALLDTPSRARLSRCDECGIYFTRAREPKKEMPIYRGSWCANCEGKGGARRTEKSRQRRTQQMVEWAADAKLRWKSDRRHGEQSSWIVDEVNARLPRDWNLISKNWVTRHMNEIEEELERRKHAKS